MKYLISITNPASRPPRSNARDNDTVLASARSLVKALSRAVSSAAGFLMVAGAFASASLPAAAQTTPSYVVSSQTQLNPNSKPSINGARGNYAVNSRGDFFVEDGNGHVLEYPAGGGAPVTLWTDSNNYGSSGVAVDYLDNLYISNFYGPGGSNDVDSQVYEFPSTNGQYPAPYVYNGGNPPGSCFPFTPVSATNLKAFGPNTGVCAAGQYTGAAYYYWQPVNVAADGLGNVYMYSNYDNTYGSTAHGIFQCDTTCNEQLPGGGATAYTTKISTTITSMIADYPGNLYFTDGTAVYLVPAGSGRAGNVPVVFDSSYTTPYGVTLDASGNMYVTDANAIWEVPAVETAGGAPCKGPTDTCTLKTASKYQILQMTSVPQYSEVSPAIDNRGNIIFSPYYGGLFEASLWAGNFPAAAIGGTSSTTLNFTVLFDKPTTLGSFSIVQGSGASTEFAVSPGTCAVGTTFQPASTCSFTATFTPTALGTRSGAVIIGDSAGKTTVTYLTGVGQGSGIAVDPGTPVSIGTNLQKPTGIAIGPQGSIYVADPTANTVTKYAVTGGAGTSIGTGLSVPTGVTVDGGGNVFIVNQGTGNTATKGTGSIVEVPIVNGALSNAAQTTLVSGLNTPTDIVNDGDGNFYVSVTGSNQVLQLANASRSSASAAMISRGTGLSGPTGLALDSSGNLYVADTGNNRVLQVGDGFQNLVGNALSAPTGVAVDASGSVMIADGSGRILRVPNETFGMNALGLNQADQQTLASPLSYPNSIRIDATGNLYASDSTAKKVFQLQRVTGSVNFGNWNLNTMSDVQTIVVSNVGTSTVTIGNPAFPAPPAGSEFSVQTGAGMTACGAGTFPSGYNCSLNASFLPTALGTQTYPLVISAAAQNNPTPTVNLVGTGVSSGVGLLKLTQTAPVGAISYGQAITITASVTPTVSGGATPTGLVVFTFDGQPRPPQTLVNGSTAITFNGVNAGLHNISAYYEGDTNYASLVSANLPLNISLATSTNVLTIVGDSANPLSVAPTNPITFTDVLTPATKGLFTGTVTFVNTATSPATIIAAIKLGSPDPVTGTYTAFFSYQSPGTAGLPLGTYNIVAQYSGNTNYFANNSASVPFIVSPPTYTVTPDRASVTSSADTPGVMNLVVTDYSNYQGAVVFTCAGLPANAFCVFRPISASLTPAPLITPNTINPVPVALQVQVDQNIKVVQGSLLWLPAAILGVLLFWRRRSLRRSFGSLTVLAALCLAALGTLGGCSSSSNFVTPVGTYAITITATSTQLLNGQQPASGGTFPNVVRTVPFSLVVK